MVYEILAEGKENAQPSRDLCRILNLSVRELTAIIERERRAGKAIAASTGANPGYYIPSTKDEMLEYCRSLERRERELRITRKACMNMIPDLPGAEK